jgi:hypothetical protein
MDSINDLCVPDGITKHFDFGVVGLGEVVEPLKEFLSSETLTFHFEL